MPDNFKKTDDKFTDDKFKVTLFENDQRSWKIAYGLCKSCGLCLEKCPVKCILWSQSQNGIYGIPSVEVIIDKCISCGNCQDICPDCAIEALKK